MAEKRHSWEILKAAVDLVGAKAVAAHLKVSQALVYKWCQRPREDDNEDGEIGSGARNPLDRVVGIVDATDDRMVVDWLCDHAGGFFTPNPETEIPEGTNFLSETQGMIERFSDLLRVLTESMNNDGRIDTDEAKNIRHAWEHLKGRLESLVVACEKGHFDQRDDATGKRLPPRR